jgi:hypothetical protein
VDYFANGAKLNLYLQYWSLAIAQPNRSMDFPREW